MILYSRTDCHLCDMASATLDRLGLDWRPVDIDRDPGLVGKYGLRVPVLRRADTGGELDYPFDDSQIRAFVGEA